MAVIRELYRPDIAVLPVGDGTTMGPKGAALALSLLDVKACIPCHFDHESYTGTPDALRALTGTRVPALVPAEPFVLADLDTG
jgi:L-ascorbate metabolism protein UlaG (beta-lactamase superfamily)